MQQKCTCSKCLLLVATSAIAVLWVIQSQLIMKTPSLLPSGMFHQSDGKLPRLKNGVPDFSRMTWQRAIQTDTTLKHDKWIVVTSIVLPTNDIKFLANIKGWRVVVVGDTKTPSNWSHPNCVYLSVADQEKMGLGITNQLPYRSYTRKNVGYLFAVAHGAKVIYETDDDNRPLDWLSSFYLKKTMSGLLYAGKEIFNPYRHFGQSTLWPRGYPLGHIGRELPTVYRFSDQWKTPSIQQGVVNGDPDMDAIFRLTRKKTLSRLDVMFDKAAPPVILPEGVFSPFNSQNTLFLYEALWAMFLPTTTTFRMCDIWRGYWAQRLLWEIGGRLAFFPPNAYQQRNAHSYMVDAEDEKAMYFNTQRLIDFLFNWTCPIDFSFFQCVYRLTMDMAEQKFWDVSEVDVVTMWLNDLLRIGYQEPRRVKVPEIADIQFLQDAGDQTKVGKDVYFYTSNNFWKIQLNVTMSEVNRRWAHSVSCGSFVNFVAAEQIPPAIHNDTTCEISVYSRHAERISLFCDNDTRVPFNPQHFLHQRPSYFHDILLIVIFNWPFYDNINYLEVTHRPVFPNIVYCGEKSEELINFTSRTKAELSFLEASVEGGLLGYFCTLKAMQVGYNVQGYFVVGDDDLVNVWNFVPYHKNRMWVNGPMYIFPVYPGTSWHWWKHNVKGYNSSMEKLQNIKSVRKGIIPPKIFLKTHADNLGARGRAMHAVADVYYIPSRLRDSAIFYLNVFSEQNVMVELTLSTLFFGLDRRQNIEFFHPTNVWGKQRLNPWKLYSVNNTVLHPVKLSNSSNKIPYCSLFLPQLLTRAHVQTQENLAIPQNLFQHLQDEYQKLFDDNLYKMKQMEADKDTEPSYSSEPDEVRVGRRSQSDGYRRHVNLLY